TQVYWQRYHEDIKPTFPEESKPGESKPGEESKGTGTAAATRAYPKSALGGKGMGSPMMSEREGGPGRGMGANMAAMMQRAMMGAGTGRRMGMGGPMGMGEGMGGPMGRGGFQPRMPALSQLAGPQAEADTIEPEEQTNLVHLAFYGIASLYERYPPKKEGTETASTPNP